MPPVPSDPGLCGMLTVSMRSRTIWRLKFPAVRMTGIAGHRNHGPVGLTLRSEKDPESLVNQEC
jgi:hypothetical protein